MSQSSSASKINALFQKINNRSTITDLLIKGSSWSFITRVSGAGLFFGAHVLLARLMGPESYGAYFFALTVINFLALLSKLGLDIATLRFVPSYQVLSEWGLMRGFLRRVNEMSLSVSVFCASVTGLVVFLIRDRIAAELAEAFFIACLVLPATVVLQVFAARLQAFKHILLSHAPQEIIRPVFLIVLALVFILFFEMPARAPMIMCIEFISIAVAIAALMYFLRQNIPSDISEATPRYQTRTWLRTSAPLSLMSGLFLILKQSDVVMVGAFLGTTQAGIYGVASRVAMLLGFGLNAVNSIAAPMISELYSQGRIKELQRMVSLAGFGVTVFSLVTGVIMISMGEFILGLFGFTFVDGYAALVILLIGQLVSALAGPTGFLMTMTGHQKQAAQIVSVSVISNILLNIILIPIMGISGAAISTTIAIILWNISMLVYIRVKLDIDSTALSLVRARP